jgi:hypothetical protein
MKFGIGMDYRLIIAGGRDFDNFTLLCAEADKIVRKRVGVEIVEGEAPGGADALSRKYAELRHLPLKPFKAEWEDFGRAAGPKRNEKMAQYAHGCLCFWDGKSPGTRSMIKLAKRYKLDLLVLNYDGVLQAV